MTCRQIFIYIIVPWNFDLLRACKMSGLNDIAVAVSFCKCVRPFRGIWSMGMRALLNICLGLFITAAQMQRHPFQSRLCGAGSFVELLLKRRNLQLFTFKCFINFTLSLPTKTIMRDVSCATNQG